MSDTKHQKRVGVLGGTFDPPHLAHLVVADQVRHALSLEEVILVPANDPWQKHGSREITPAKDRLELTQLAVGDSPNLSVSDIELRLGGPSYSYNTVQALKEQRPGVDWLLIVGADAAAGLNSWHRADELRESVSVCVVNRPGADFQPPTGWRWELVEVPALNISGSSLRRRVAQRNSIRFLTPNAVLNKINELELYRK